MADAAERRPGSPPGSVRLKWPNDLVVGDRRRRLSASWPGSSGETDGLGNVGAARGRRASASTPTGPRPTFPPDLASTMTSLRELAAGRPVDRDAAPRRLPRRASRSALRALRTGSFDADGWTRPPAHDRPPRPARGPQGGERDRPRPARRLDDRRAGRRGSATATAASARSSSARSATSASPAARRGVTRWPVRHLEGEAVRRRAVRALAHLDRDRPLVEAARRIRPGSRPSIGSTWPRCTATRSTSSATITRPRTPRSGRSSPRSPTSTGSRSAPGPRTATARRRSASGSSRSPATSSPNAAPDAAPPPRGAARGRRPRRRRRRRRGRTPRPRDEAADGVAGRRAPARRSAPGDRSCASSTRCRPPRSPASSAGPRAPSASSSTAPCGRVARDLDDGGAGDAARDAGRRDGDEVEALVTDRYLERAPRRATPGADRGPADADARSGRSAAPPTGSRRDLPRFHPSFRFEEAPRRPPRRGGRRGCACRAARRRGGGCVVPFRAGAAVDGALDGLDRWPTPTTSAARLGRPAAHRRRPDLGRALARRRRLRRLAAQPAAGRARWSRAVAGASPGRGSPDADQAAVVPRPPRRLPARPLDQVPVLRDDAVQQAARQGHAGLPDLRPPLPAVGRGPPRAAARPRHVGRARRRPPVGRPRSGSSTRRPYPDRLAAAQLATGMRDAAVWGTGAIERPRRSRSASWTSGSWAARWARSSARRSPAPPSTPSRARVPLIVVSAPRAGPGCRRARSR